MPSHRKRVKHYHEPGDLHELTCSCYRGKPLLARDDCLRQLCIAIDHALERHAFRLVAFVLMPEHVHLLVHPTANEPRMDRFLSAVKRPFSYRMKQWFARHEADLLEQLTIRERPGKRAFRFWQEGGGYDRNFSGEKATLAAIDYIHANPVRRDLVTRALDWKWSSAR